MSSFQSGKAQWIGGLILLAIFLMIGLVLLNGKITDWVNSDSFRRMLDRETSKGLKFDGEYFSLARVGLLGMHANYFNGEKGQKTIVAIQASDISGSFNPLGLGLKRWQLDNIHIRSGNVMLQKTEATPGAPKGYAPIPWWGLFWPYKVYLTDVKVDYANILWKLRDKESGIYATFLEITPNGRDFEYDARGGLFVTPITPHLEVRHAHLLIRKPRLYCSDFVLGDDEAHPEKGVRITGDAGLQDDRSVNLKIDLTALNVSPWFPTKLQDHILGHADGHLEYSSSGTGLETATGHGNLIVKDGKLHDLALIHQYITVTGSPDPGDLLLKVCQADIKWQQGAITLENIDIESEGVFHVTGGVTLAKDKTLNGSLELGLTDPYLHWLPTAKQAIFTREEGGYHFATIAVSGTLQKPHQDLTERIVKEIQKSPLLALKLFFNQAGEWFDSN